MSKTTEVVETLIRPVIGDLGLSLVDVEYLKEGRDWFLRVYIDKDGGVDLDDCALASEKISLLMDENDPIKEQYFLEVSSPGAERPLKTKEDLEKSVGSYINVKTFEKINGEKEFQGTLLSFEDDELTLEMKVKTAKRKVTVPYEKVAKARIAIQF